MNFKIKVFFFNLIQINSHILFFFFLEETDWKIITIDVKDPIAEQLKGIVLCIIIIIFLLCRSILLF